MPYNQSGYPTGSGFRKPVSFANPNPYNKGLGYSAPQVPRNLGELVPSQSGPNRYNKGTPSANTPSTNRVKAAMRRADGTLGLGDKYVQNYAKRAAHQEAMRMAKLLGQLFGFWNKADTLLSLAAQLDLWVNTNEIHYNHPAGAVKLEDCDNPITHGPASFDGDCVNASLLNNAAFYDVPSWQTDFFGRTIWRYHEWIAQHPTIPSTYFRKSEKWRSAVGTFPGQVGRAAFPLPPPFPAIGVGTSGAAPTKQSVATGFRPFRRPDERKKGLAQKGYALAAWAYGGTDELRELVDAIWDSMQGPCKGKSKGKGILAKGSDIARCAGTIDLAQMAENILWNQFEDAIIGRAQGKASKATRGLRGGKPGVVDGIGSGITGPAL